MMSFVLIVSRNAREIQTLQPLFLKDISQDPWTTTLLSPHALLFCRQQEVISSHTPKGHVIVIGRLYRKCGEQVRRLESSEHEQILKSAGLSLVQDYWGSYIAIIFKQATQQVIILRDPLGSLPCFYNADSEKIIIFSSLADVESFLPRVPSVNESFVIKALCYHRVTTHETGLTGISALCSGQALIMQGSTYQTTWYWNPVDYASLPYRGNFLEASEGLRDLILKTLHVQAQHHHKILLYFSGGLDSAIVAGALKNAALLTASAYETLGFNYKVVHSNASDEVAYAQACAFELGLPLMYAQLDPFDADVLHEGDYMLSPLPSPQYLATPLWKKAQEVARQNGCDLIWDGDGGDQIFYAFRTSRVLNDYLFLNGVDFGLVQKTREVAKLCDNAIFPILREVWKARKDVNAKAIYRDILAEKKPFLNPALFEKVAVHDLVPSLFQDKRFPLGKTKQIAGILNLQLNTVPLNGPLIPSQHPLGNQPLVELCLSLPSYVLTEGGVSRGLIRHAMKGIVPEIVRNRFSKGTTSKFITRWFDHPGLREYLLDGQLVKRGYVNRAKLENIFRTTADYHTKQQVIDVLPVEIWLRKIAAWISQYHTYQRSKA